MQTTLPASFESQGPAGNSLVRKHELTNADDLPPSSNSTFFAPSFHLGSFRRSTRRALGLLERAILSHIPSDMTKFTNYVDVLLTKSPGNSLERSAMDQTPPYGNWDKKAA